MRPTGLILGDTFAAEIRHRATGDTRFLLPGRARVKRTRCRSALAGVEGLEPPTPGFGDRCSDQLSYTPSARRGGATRRCIARRRALHHCGLVIWLLFGRDLPSADHRAALATPSASRSPRSQLVAWAKACNAVPPQSYCPAPLPTLCLLSHAGPVVRPEGARSSASKCCNALTCCALSFSILRDPQKGIVSNGGYRWGSSPA